MLLSPLSPESIPAGYHPSRATKTNEIARARIIESKDLSIAEKLGFLAAFRLDVVHPLEPFLANGLIFARNIEKVGAKISSGRTTIVYGADTHQTKGPGTIAVIEGRESINGRLELGIDVIFNDPDIRFLFRSSPPPKDPSTLPLLSIALATISRNTVTLHES